MGLGFRVCNYLSIYLYKGLQGFRVQGLYRVFKLSPRGLTTKGSQAIEEGTLVGCPRVQG